MILMTSSLHQHAKQRMLKIVKKRWMENSIKMTGRESIARTGTETTRSTKTETGRRKIGTNETETSTEKTEAGTGKEMTGRRMRGREGIRGTESTGQREEIIIAQKTQVKVREAVILHMTHLVIKHATTCRPSLLRP